MTATLLHGMHSQAQSRRVLAAGQGKWLGLRVHGNQLGSGPGVRIAVAPSHVYLAYRVGMTLTHQVFRHGLDARGS